MSVLGFFLLLLTLDLIPVAVAIRPIVNRARRSGIAVEPHAVAAAFGGLIAGFLLNGLAVQFFLRHTPASDRASFRWQQVAVLGGGMFGSAAAVGAVFLHLRMVTQRDADYEEPRTPPKP